MADIKVFLSYAHEDESVVKQLYQNLKNAKFRPWLDTEDILPGERWEVAIRRGIRESNYLLACLSNSSVTKRGYVQRELKRAIEVLEEFPEEEIFLIPVRLDDCPMPESLRSIQWVDLFQPDGFDRLFRALSSKEQPEVLSARPSAASGSSLPTELLPSERLKFVNREHELEEIRNPGGPEHVILDAPPGYGKSRLLEEVEHWYRTQQTDSWACARIELDLERYKGAPARALDEIARQIIGTSLASGQLDELIEKIADQKKHILLLFDGVEANLPVTNWLQKEVVSPLWNALGYTELLGRVVFAGRYLQRLEWRGYKVIKLTVLDEHIVRQAVFDELGHTALNPGIKDILAKEIAFLSGGHPGIVADILSHPPRGGWVLAVKDNHLKLAIQQVLFRDHAQPVIEDILSKTGDPDLGEALRILSTFRRFDLNTIQALQILASGKATGAATRQALEEFGVTTCVELLGPFVKLQDDPMDLLARLVGSGLVSPPTPTRRYYHDSIIRKLLLTQMLVEKGSNVYRGLNAVACAIYEAWADSERVDGGQLPFPVVGDLQIAFVVESFYHLLNYLDREQRARNEEKIASRAQWHIGRLRSSFGYDEAWLRRSLKDTVHQDEDVPNQVLELVGEDGAQRIFQKLSPDSA
jgi:hypothetical protein